MAGRTTDHRYDRDRYRWGVPGGWAASKFFGIAATGGFFDLSTWFIAVIGSVVLLLIYYAIVNGSRGRGRSRRPGLFTSRR